MAYQRLKACARPVCVQRWCGCERAWRKKAATLSRPNAQVKQQTSVTVGFFVFVFFSVKLLLLSWKTKAFPFQQFVSFINVGQNQYVMKMKQIYSFGAKL